MPVELRYLKPESRCANPLRLCELYRRFLEDAVREMNDLAAFAGDRAPDWDITVECRSFCPRPGGVRR